MWSKESFITWHGLERDYIDYHVSNNVMHWVLMTTKHFYFFWKKTTRISLYGLCILLRPQVWRHLVQVTPWVETQTPGIWGHDRETFTMYVSFCHSAQWCKEVGPCIVFFKNQFLSNPAFCPIWHKPKTWKLKNLKIQNRKPAWRMQTDTVII